MTKTVKLKQTQKENVDESTRLLDNRLYSFQDEEVVDKYNLVYIIYFIYGVSMLLPWNVFITASEFFARRFVGTPYHETFQNYFSTYSTLTNLLTFVYILYKQNKSVYNVSSFSSILINTVIFALLAITVETKIEGYAYFWFIMSLIVLTGITTGFFQNSVFSEASQLPPIYMQAVLSGQGIAGVIVAVSSITSALAGNPNEPPNEASISQSAFLYFLSAFVITLSSLVGRILVVRLPYYRSKMNVTTEVTIEEQSEIDQQTELEPVKLIDVVKKLKGLTFAVSYIFIITLVLFPSITALIKSVRRPSPLKTHGRFFDDDIFVAFHFLLFNVGDWVGRVMPAAKIFQFFNVPWLVSLTALRSLFIPLFLVCNVIISDERHLPVLIQSDLVYFILIWIFSVTNGWFCSLCMMAAPQVKSITSSKEKALVGSVMSFSLVVGLAIGGSLSFIIRWMV